MYGQSKPPTLLPAGNVPTPAVKPKKARPFDDRQQAAMSAALRRKGKMPMSGPPTSAGGGTVGGY